MFETAIVAFTTFFATIGPVDVAVIYAVLTRKSSAQMKKAMAIRGCFIALVILICFAVIGEKLLTTLGISLAALKFAGGILLLLIAIDMVFARTSGGTSTTPEENEEAVEKQDVSVFPLATPLIAGPGTMGATILLMANAEQDLATQAVVITALLSVLLITLVLLLLANQVQRLLGVTGMHVIGRVFGVLLSALAVQFMFDGLAQSGLLAALN
jgi:multiple antibiotic resistance protein